MALEPGTGGVPVLTTPRLVLRGHRASDLESSLALWGDPAVVRLISGTPSSREDCWARLLRYAGLWPTLGFGYWLLEERDGGRFIGEAGFADFKRSVEPDLGDALEAGWLVVPSEHGKGYATEAMQAALAWAETTLAPRRSVCMVAPENAASLRVAAKCGYRSYAATTYKEAPTLLLERTIAARPGDAR